ncbi:hypothetical protein BGZ49_005134, partial [Haplosporangium sp. Z 27]
EGETEVFMVKAPLDYTVHELKEAIRNKKKPEFDGFATDEITPWKTKIRVFDDLDYQRSAKDVTSDKS